MRVNLNRQKLMEVGRFVWPRVWDGVWATFQIFAWIIIVVPHYQHVYEVQGIPVEDVLTLRTQFGPLNDDRFFLLLSVYPVAVSFMRAVLDDEEERREPEETPIETRVSHGTQI